MTEVEIQAGRRDMGGGYKVDVSRGSHVGRVSSEWFSRPDDERYLSLSELYASVKGRAERSRTRTVESAAIRVEAHRNDPERLALVLPDAEAPVAPTHWSFGQLASLVSAPAAYLRQLPAPLAGINLQYGLTAHRAEQIKTLETDDGRTELRAVTGPDYGRIYDHELVAAVQRIAGDGVGDTRWKVPGVLDWLSGVYRLKAAEKIVQGRDFTCMPETLNAAEAWLGSLPGHLYANVRQPPVSTLNLAHMIPISAVWAGPARNDHLDGPPLFHAETEGSTPFRFSLHVGDVGHTLVVGPTGSGKSVLLALMALQFRRYAGAQVFAFDFGGSIRCATLAMGGDWQDLAGALSEDEAAVQLQPLARIDLAQERAWAQDWLAGLLAREGVAVDPVARDHLWSALTSLASAPAEERTLTGLSVLLQSTELKRALAPYCLGGPFGRLLDAEAEALGTADVAAFETEGLIGSAAAPAVLAYLFHRIEVRLGSLSSTGSGSRPSLVIVDEGWLALDDATFGGQLREWLKTLRKKNASVIFATQSLADIDGSAIAPAIVESCPTRVFLANERALEPQIAAIYRRFGLNDRQIEIVARAVPKRDYYCQSRRGNRLFALGLGEIALAFTAASSKADQAAIAETLAAHGRAGFAAAWLGRRGLDWAVELLGPAPHSSAEETTR